MKYLKRLSRYTNWFRDSERMACEFWPRPLTLANTEVNRRGHIGPTRRLISFTLWVCVRAGYGG